ncbi:glutathione peroxidase [Ramlibacter sp. AW1]|uniref:Glutathione peroxidase n=1 Tax=Ramlibacter aurantiacus TaxID=2801330 RepID=A0A936ZZC0_9BURK|nr:glutathione peroxidase [Ramlibacter aurantiacus]
MQFHDLCATDIEGKPHSFGQHRGKVVLVVNTASRCGFTPQFAGLQKLHERHADQGLVILGFPCNQFMAQEPGDAHDILEFYSVNYGVTFPIMAKGDVNGPAAHPVFRYLKSRLPGAWGAGRLVGGRIMWNFTKFVIDRQGVPVKRFSPRTTPGSMAPFLKSTLGG